MRIGLWNVEWAKPERSRGQALMQRLKTADVEVWCVTEGYANLFQPGHVICSGEDFGYATTDGRRKVLLWSSNPWSQVRTEGPDEMPPGRFVSGITETTLGPVQFVAVCVPWKDAHVKTGRRDRQPWQDHLAYLESLRALLTDLPRMPTVLLGDFNQRLPRARQPQEVHKQLIAAVSSTWECVTSGKIGEFGQAIDHVFLSPEIKVTTMTALSPEDDALGALSDHFGFVVELMTKW